MAINSKDLGKALTVTSPVLILAVISLIFAFNTVANPPKAQKFVPPTQTQKTTPTVTTK